MPVIETPQPRDVEALATLFKEDMDDLGVDVSLDELRELADAVVNRSGSGDPECLCWVARLEDGGPAVGVILANINYSLKFAGRSLWIEELYVTPAGRRHGLGRVLVEVLLVWAEDPGIKGVALEAYQGNTPASILYRSLGFRRLGRERFYYEIDQDLP